MYRVGTGFDAHRFAAGRTLMLGGVKIPKEMGLKGHSDADVVLHALADALLGAAGLDDIGTHFPDTDSKWKGASSGIFIREICKMLKRRKFETVNVDLTIFAQKTRISPHRAAIKKSVAKILGLDSDCVNVKATTTDEMGFLGRGEGMAAQAVVLLKKKR